MKKVLSLLLIIFSCLILTGCGFNSKKEETAYEKIVNRDLLIVGVKTDSKPFGFISKNTNEIVGYDIDIAKNIAADILGSERKIKLVSVNPNTRIEAITSGQVDIVCATMSVNKQREYLVDFSKPYYATGQTALIKEDSDIYTFTDLKKKRTIVVMGTTSEKNIRRIIPTAHLIGYKNYAEAFEAFLNGYGDAIISDDTILSGFLIDHAGYRLLKNRITKEYYAVAMKKYDEDDSLKKSVDSVIIRLSKDGTLKELKKKWKLR